MVTIQVGWVYEKSQVGMIALQREYSVPVKLTSPREGGKRQMLASPRASNSSHTFWLDHLVGSRTWLSSATGSPVTLSQGLLQGSPNAVISPPVFTAEMHGSVLHYAAPEGRLGHSWVV